MNGNDGFTGQDLANAIMMGNQVALQWYAVTHQQQAPVSYGGIVMQPTTTGGTSVTAGSGVLVVLLLLGGIVIYSLSR